MAALSGTWRLARWIGGPDGALGLLICTDDGWFAVHVSGAKGAFVAEAGSYDLEDNTVVMTAEVSLDADVVGTRRPRQWQVHGDVLELHWDGADTRWHRALDEVVDSMGG